MRALLPFLACVALLGAAEPAEDELPPGAKMSYLDNGMIRVGVDLNHGGAIVYLAPKGGRNLINNHDLGRQVQMSFYSGPVPYTEKGQSPSEHWKGLGWNPIQTGDDHRNPSKVIAHENDGKRLHVACIPMQWPLDNVPGECTFDAWIELENTWVKVRSRLTNARADRTLYRARQQELPAVYANASFFRVVSYVGTRPFTGEAITEQPKSKTKHPWVHWQATERWSALLDAADEGLGLITPHRVDHTGGFAGQPGPNASRGNATGYLAGQGLEILDHDIRYDYDYELVVGNLRTIRARAAEVSATREPTLPRWAFVADRQGWSYAGTGADTGWPIKGELNLLPDGKAPFRALSPLTFWQAEQAGTLTIEAAFSGPTPTATAVLSKHALNTSGTDLHVTFPIQADGQMRRYTLPLAKPGYAGAFNRVTLLLNPQTTGARVKSVELGK
jgi:hypothetical protein